MRIVFFNRSYYPDGGATGQLLAELAEDLAFRYGSRITVVAGPVPEATARLEPRPPTPSDSEGELTVVRTRGTRLERRSLAGRIVNYLSYFVSALWYALVLPPADVVVAFTDPPIVGLAAYLMAKRTGARFVFVCQDVFPEVADLLTPFRIPFASAMLHRVNRFLVRRTECIVALGECMKARLVEGKGADPAKVTVIHNWADTEKIVPGSKDNVFSREQDLAERFVVMHSGNLGLSQNLDTLIETAGLLEKNRDIAFVLVGDGVRREELEATVAERGLRNVRFVPYQPKERLSESFASADVFVVSLKPGLSGYIVPSKLYGILAAGRPYVAAVEPETEPAAITRRFECGVVVAPGDAGGMADAITGLYRDRERARRYGRNARRASAEFDRRRQVLAYRELFQSVLVDRNAPAHAPCEARS